VGPENAVTRATPASTGVTQSRHLQQVTLSMLDSTAAVGPDATCTASNEKGIWTDKRGDTITIRSAGGNLHISCARIGHVVASALVINVAIEPFGGDTVATVPKCPGAIAMPAAGDAVSRAPRQIDSTDLTAGPRCCMRALTRSRAAPAARLSRGTRNGLSQNPVAGFPA
jgi:hypothetical protein